MTRRLMLAWFALAGALGGACSPDEPVAPTPDAAGLQMEERTARLVSVEGDVRVKRSGEPEWRRAQSGMELTTNDKVRTQRDGFATIEFEAGGVLRLEPESLVAVTDLRLETRTQARRSTFTLVEGRVEAELDAPDEEGSEFRIKTPSAQAAVVRREVTFQ